MALVARITGIIAAIIWFIGAPLFALAGVPFPSDAQYLVEGTIAVLLGLALIPVTQTIGGPIKSRKKTFVRLSGLAVCVALFGSGVMSILAVQGRFGQSVGREIVDTAVVVVVALFVWVTAASIFLRGPSTIDRWQFWLGVLTGVSCVMPVIGSILMFYFAQGFVFTNATVLPLFLVDLLLWISLPAWLTVVVVGLPKTAAA
ncbi:MAG TPA: hypothetical protein VN895_01060 [Candidatus Acidoferrum sp.]|nr:hypothetical protein [Candidatus Acidoferrum sp.]